MSTTLPAHLLVPGEASGALLHADVGISFWGGVDPESGIVIDHTHPLRGTCISGKVLAIPNGRGSCTGSQVVLELLDPQYAPDDTKADSGAVAKLRRPVSDGEADARLSTPSTPETVASAGIASRKSGATY